MLYFLFHLGIITSRNRVGSRQKLSDKHPHYTNKDINSLCDRYPNSDSSDFDQGISAAGFIRGSSNSELGQKSSKIGYGMRLSNEGLGLGLDSGNYNSGAGHEGIKKSAYIAEIEARSKMEAEMNHRRAKAELFNREQELMMAGNDWRESPNAHVALSWQKHQDWKDLQRFQNVENFENFKDFQNYREPQPFNEIKHEEYPPFSKGLELKFTNLSTTARIENYLRIFSHSKIFIIETKEDATAYVNLVSTTKNYHPQFRIYERRGSEYILMQNINFNNKFFFSHSGFYIIEIGTDSNIDTTPFENIKEGGFIVIISSYLRTIEEIMNDEEIKISLWRYEGYVPFTHNSELSLFHSTYKYISHGICNYQITPYYDLNARKLCIYYHKGSSQNIGKIMRASVVEISCNRTSNSPRLFYGTEPRQGMCHFPVECKRVCELFEKFD